MSVEFSAKLVYGVLLNSEEETKLNNHSNKDELYDNWICIADSYSPYSSYKILGIVMDGAGAGDCEEISIKEPVEDMDDLLDILDELEISRDPTWHLVCAVN